MVRVTIVNNTRHSVKALMNVREGTSFASFLREAGAKVNISGRKAYSQAGAEIDSVELLRDDDMVFISQGESFAGDAGGGRGGSSLYAIAVMGPGSVGKSSLSIQFTKGVFVVDYDPTIEDAYRKSTYVDDAPCLLDILDTAGQEDYTALRSTWMRERDGFVLVFSLTARETIKELRAFHDQLCVIHEDAVPPFILVGNKADLVDRREVEESEGKELALEWGAVRYIETSAKTGQGVERTFEELVRAMREAGIGAGDLEDVTKKKWYQKCTLL